MLLTVFHLVVGFISVSALGYVYLLQRRNHSHRRFMVVVLAGLAVFALGGPLTRLIAPDFVHFVHSVATLLVILGLYDPVSNEIRNQEWATVVWEDPRKAREPSEWMKPMDEDILELCHSTDLILTPVVISINLDYSRDEVNRRVSVLTNHDLLERVKRGKYQITDKGNAYLRGELTRSTVDQDPG